MSRDLIQIFTEVLKHPKLGFLCSAESSHKKTSQWAKIIRAFEINYVTEFEIMQKK